MPIPTTSEAVGNWIYLIFTVPLTAMLGVFGHMFKKLQGTLPKEEIIEHIELRTAPMKEGLDSNTQSIKDLGTKVDEGHKEINKKVDSNHKYIQETLGSIQQELTKSRIERKGRRRLYDPTNSRRELDREGEEG